MIAMYAVVGNWPGDSAQRQPCQHVLDGLPYAPIMCVAQGLECGSYATAPTVLTIRRVVHRSPSWSQGCWMGAFNHYQSFRLFIMHRHHQKAPYR